MRFIFKKACGKQATYYLKNVTIIRIDLMLICKRLVKDMAIEK